VEDSARTDVSSLIGRQGPLNRDEARLLLDRGADLLERGEFVAAFQSYARVYGFDDPEITAAAMLGAGQARFRMDAEAEAVAIWEKILELPETPSTYYAWREIAGARVRDGDLQGAIAAYREAERRAPAEDKAEIATRLGWLAKETGNVRASRRYFARGRGAVMPWVTYGILGITVAVSLTAEFSTDGGQLLRLLALDKPLVAQGELWRLWTVVLVHGGLLHLGFNMYALYLTGPLVEQIYGPIKMLVLYLVAAAAGSIASFGFSTGPGNALAVGASGAIFGLFGILFVASRLHMPVLDRQGRAILGQIGMLIVLNLIIGFIAFVAIDNLAHLGGLAAGLLLGVVFTPSANVDTLASRWQPGTARPLTRRFLGSTAATVLALAVLIAGMAIGLVAGFNAWG
jgi:membrane associated rhomboid family serine protease